MRNSAFWKKALVGTAPYVSEFGAVVFTATAVFGLLAAVGEFLDPGFAINYVPPKVMFAALAVSGCLALVPGRPAKAASRWARARFIVIAAAVVVGSAAASWYYFGPLPEARIWLTSAATATVGGVLWCAARRTDRDSER